MYKPISLFEPFKALPLLLATLLFVPVLATAQQLAYASKVVSVRAGPSRDYPVVVNLASGSAMTIFGCLNNYKWCDVEAGNYRGWVNGNNIVYPYLGENVTVLNYGPSIGLGVVTFSIGSYWDNYYAAYPWYPQRLNWANRPWAGNGAGYGSGHNWRAPTATVRAVNPNIVRNPQLRNPPPRQANPQRLPRAQVQPVGRPANAAIASGVQKSTARVGSVQIGNVQSSAPRSSQEPRRFNRQDQR